MSIKKLRDVPSNLGDQAALGDWLKGVRQMVNKLAKSSTPLANPTTLTATALAAGILVRFTRSNSPNYLLYASNTPNINDATHINLGDNTQYTDHVGKDGIQRWYWVQATGDSRPSSDAVGPVTATSLAVGTVVTIPPPPTQYNPRYPNPYIPNSGQATRSIPRGASTK